ncbi:MAG: serine/threonine-protein kinase [Polyangiaceae bacterium]
MAAATHPTGPEVTTIGKYQLIANLGHGGMADVYLSVVHGPVGFNKLTVIKRLRPSLAEEPEFLAMFLDEARLAARLNHPNVVQTNEVAEVDGVYFIAMEYLDGQPLNRILHRAVKSGEMPREILLRVVADALAGLHHAHELTDYDGSPIGVVHRDASPHNIFVTYDGQTKVVDFGIAKAATRSSETRGGVLKGKIAYMAPEQARSDEVDRRADVFAMGLVMWEVLTGSRLRRGSDLEMLERIGIDPVPRLSTAVPGCPPKLEEIVAKATALAKDDRYPTAAAMRQDILEYLDSAKERSSAEEVGKLVSRMFEAKRAEMKGIIERQLSGLRRAALEDVPLKIVDARRYTADSLEMARASFTAANMPWGATTGGTASVSRVTPVSGPFEADRGSGSGAISTGTSSVNTGTSSVNTGHSASQPTSTLASPAAGSKLRAPLLIAAVAIGAAATVLALRGNGGSASGATTGATTTTAQDTAAPASSTIEVHLSAKPATAKLFLDDSALPSNPFVGRFKRDDKGHVFRVEAEGFTPTQRTVMFNSDQTLEVALDRSDAPTHPDKTASPEKPTAPGTAAPGDGLQRPPVKPPQKPLDGDDPWR